jgi:uncharacterized protein (DUF342 family)
MKKLILAIVVFASPALAQQPQSDPASLQYLIASLQKQRNMSMDAAALADARLSQLMDELQKVNAQVKQLSDELQKLKESK